ncbi:MAG: response regulator [Acidimicrobiaceae bacterium]|nr:response regulator [Acidimicrobiaceae bacterium]
MSDTTLARSRPFVLRYYEHRRSALMTPPRDADPAPLFEQLALAALPDFAHWVAVVDPVTHTTFSRCVVEHEHSFHACSQHWANGLDIDAAVTQVIADGEGLAWNSDPSSPHGIISPLTVEDESAGAVLVARDTHGSQWSEDDLGAIHDVVTALGVDLERLRLRYQSRLALRASQRVASQLHQLISASLAVEASSDEASIVQGLSRSARSVFEADRAVVALHTSHQQFVGFAELGRIPRLLDGPTALDLGVPAAREDASEPWSHDDWLCAPVLDSQRRSRGVVAAHRAHHGLFSDEDRELAMLLGQLAATSLDALELNRTIQDNETRLRILVDAAPISIVESDEAGAVRWWNRAASRLLKWPDFSADAVGQVSWPADVRTSLVALWADLLMGGLRDTEEFLAAVGGRDRLLSVSAAVVPSGGSTPHILTLLDDVTDQRELREEVRHAHRMELRGQVASSVAHDFNNLITLILGYSELLSRNVAGDEKSAELVRDIQATSSRASTLTAQLQSIGRTSEPALVRLDVGAALSANAEVLERIMGSKNTVVWCLADVTPPVVVDADLFEQMILNMSINARDAMPEGGTLRLASATLQLPHEEVGALDLPAGQYVVLTIADTGIGMDEDTKSRCFEPLFTTKGPFKGTGLGLTSARRLVAASGGVITCDSQLGAGTTFNIYLPTPATPIAPEFDAPSPATTAPAQRARVAATILLVEDDANLRRLAFQVLQRNGFVVLEAVSAEDALEIFHRLHEPLDLLVSDVVLPEMAGPVLAATLQRAQPGLVVLMMSGTASSDAISALTPGSATFLAKPFKPSTLVDEAIALLSRRTRAAN